MGATLLLLLQPPLGRVGGSRTDPSGCCPGWTSSTPKGRCSTPKGRCSPGGGFAAGSDFRESTLSLCLQDWGDLFALDRINWT